MELLAGRSLKRRMEDGPLSVRELSSTACQVCAALQAAHDKGIVHRDLKPENIFVSETGQVKVLDFGLAKRETEISPPGLSADLSDYNTALTDAGAVLGTLAYMSPEQAVGRIIDLRSDIFSLGVVLYEMATGHRPFRGKTSAGILGSILTEAPRRPSEVRADIPAALDRVILKALEKDPAKRYRCASDVSAALNRFATAKTSHRVRWLTSAAAVVALVVGLLGTSRWGYWAPPQTQAMPRQVTANPAEDPIMQAAISPDGKTVAYEDFTGIHLRRIDTGETRVIPPPPNYCFR
jgi:serine/threonine protein kinase